MATQAIEQSVDMRVLDVPRGRDSPDAGARRAVRLNALVDTVYYAQLRSAPVRVHKLVMAHVSHVVELSYAAGYGKLVNNSPCIYARKSLSKSPRRCRVDQTTGDGLCPAQRWNMVSP